MGALHAYAIATRLQQVSENQLHLNQGTLYPALVRLEQQGWIKGTWGRTESNREARFYAITKSGVQALAKEKAALAADGRPGRKTLDGGHLTERRFVKRLTDVLRGAARTAK